MLGRLPRLAPLGSDLLRPSAVYNAACYLAPKKYFLSMDEVRIGGFCQTCRGRHLSMAQILGDCVTRPYRMIHAANPTAEVYSWSDMFDPNHNAREKYYLVGIMYTSWEEKYRLLPAFGDLVSKRQTEITDRK